jgi:UDP-N-acetylmuramyl tripeptide synthase
MFSDQKIVHNKTGANFEDGLITAFLQKVRMSGKMDVDYAIFEVDELVLAKVLHKTVPLAIVVLNLFRDQLDRYGEMHTLLHSWQQALVHKSPSIHLFLNADDPLINHLGEQLPQKITYFGLQEPNRYVHGMSHAVDSIYCPRCDTPLSYQGFYLSHLGDYFCTSCSAGKKNVEIDSKNWPQISVETYNKYNTMAAICVGVAMGIDEEKIREAIRDFQPAFGRGEILLFQEKKIMLLLSKNPVSMNATIQRVCKIMQQEAVGAVLLVLNDQEMDGTDISWIWDVDVEPLVAKGKTCIVSGYRAHELALRLHYSAEGGTIHVEENVEKAIALALAHTGEQALLPILPTYSAMLGIRKVLVGRKIL